MSETLETHFPNTITIAQLFDRIDTMVRRYAEVDRVKSALALCRDDSVKEMHKESSDRGYDAWFGMDTLSGVPVFGYTGMVAWYHHIPDEGIGLIVYSPHIGVDSDGTLGNLNRFGQDIVGKSCGANHVLVEHWSQGRYGPYSDDPELSAVAQVMAPHRDDIMASADPLVDLTKKEYDVGMEVLFRHVKKLQETEHHKFPVLLVGGIHIDMPYGTGNKFQLKDIYMFKEGIQDKL